jgi:hypothetical protein
MRSHFDSRVAVRSRRKYFDVGEACAPWRRRSRRASENRRDDEKFNSLPARQHPRKIFSRFQRSKISARAMTRESIPSMRLQIILDRE